MAKKKILPTELQLIVDDIRKKQQEEDYKEVQELIDNVRLERSNDKSYWDVPINQEITCFDPTLSYEITGYRPIDETHSLDFNPDWFTEVREVFKKTGKYCSYLPRSKRWDAFWKEQYKRCKYGMTSHGYTITGDNYFFLNFYQLPVIDQNEAAGSGTEDNFPNFMASQYMFFHYLQMCRVLRRNACLMKARSIGFSEIMASIAARMYTAIKKSRTLITCFKDVYLKGTFSKVDHALTFLNMHADGFFKPRLKDTSLEIKSGFQVKKDGQFVDDGWQSVVKGILADKPSKIRGDRVDLLIYDEAGSWNDLTTAVVQGRALCEVQGIIRGIQVYGGTGGDIGAALEGLKKIYYNPKSYKVLPFRHSWTQDGAVAETGFFIPYFLQSLNPKYMDSRGVCNQTEYKKILTKERNELLSVPDDYVKHCAEYCWNAEEAFTLEGQNKFNKTIIANQLANIRLHKIGPKPQVGLLDYTYKNNKHTLDNVDGFRWIPGAGKVQILEHPVWSPLYKEQIDKQKKEAEEQGLEFTPQTYQEMNDMYVAGIDGIDIGANQTSKETRDPSDFCIVIKKRAFGMNEPQYVAMYKDRPANIREAYKIAMCMCRYYNAKINIEATRMGMVTWARENKCLQYFMKRPRATLTDIKYGTTKQYGTPATKAIIEQQTDLIADFVEDYGHTIWFEEMLEQLNNYNDENKTKFDIIASLGMVELADQELSGRQPTKVDKEVEEFQDIGYYIDEKGYRHFGAIPKKPIQQILINWEKQDDSYRIETSDPRLLQDTVLGRFYRRYSNY